MSKPDEQNSQDAAHDDETVAPDDVSANGEDDATLPPSDDTASLAAPDDGATFVENIEASGLDAPEVSNEEPASDATMRLEDAPEPSALDEDATIGDAQLMRDPPTADPSHAGDGATIAQPDDDGGDHTLADPGLASGTDSSVEDNGATQGLPDGPVTADADQTMVDNSLDNPDSRPGATSGATMMESVDNPDATQVEYSTGESADDRTVMESEYKSATGGGSVHDGTQILDESAGSGSGTRGPRRPRRKGAHETADRWEYEQRYQLVSNFARGGLGQIWMANDTRLRREVAFKELLPSALTSRNSVERFLEEAQITGQLEHPGIVPIYDIGYQQNGTPFYAMKLVRGDTMEKAFEQFHQLPKDSPDWSLARRKLLGNFIDVCNAIAFAHDRGVLHRDLKPLNVMLGAFGETLVLDWGLAKVLDEMENAVAEDGSPITANPGGFSIDGETIIENSTTGSTDAGAAGAGAASDATQALNSTGATGAAPAGGASAGAATSGGATAGGVTGAKTAGHSQVSFGGTKTHVRTDVRTAGSQTMMGSIMGTPAYMPPEQAKGKLDEIDARADIYSLGGILYKLLTNQQPVKKGKNIKELLKRVIDGEIIPPREHDSSIEKPLEAICLKALATKREDRYQSALDLVKDVEAFLADEPVSCFEDPPLVKLNRWRKRNPKKVGAAGATLVAGFVFWIGSSAIHASTLAGIRSFAATKVEGAETAARAGQFDEAATALNEAIGRAGSEPDLVDLKQSLENRLALVEQTRLQQLEVESKRRLQMALDDFRAGRFGNARTSLAETLVLIGDEESLVALKKDADLLLTRIESAIAEQGDIEATRKRFEEFRTLADEARARGSMPGSANQREDAQQALATGQKALALFDLVQDRPLAQPPKWFGQDLPWVVEFQRTNGKWPLEVLRADGFELMVLLADLELFLSKDGTAEEINAAAERGLAWTERAKATGARSRVPLVWQEVCLRRLGRNDEADVAHAEAEKIKPNTALDFFLLGESARKAGRYQDALVQYLAVVRLDSGHYWTQHCTGLCYLELGIPQAAVSAFSSAASLREGYAWPLMLRGVAYGQLKMFEPALADFEAAIAIDPNLFNIYVNRGAMYLSMGRSDDSLADFKQAGELEADSPVPHINNAAWHNERARQIREGEGAFAAISDVERIQQEAAEFEAALDALDQAEKVKNAARNPGIIALRAKIFSRQGNDAVALNLFETHTRLATTAQDKASSFKRIGYIQFRGGNFAAALAAFQQADRLVPADPETTFLLGETQLRSRQPQEALRYYRAFDELARSRLQSEINRPEALYTGIATALNALGKKDEAIEYYTLAIKNNPDLAAAITRRGWAYAASGLDLARADFENAKKQNPNNADTLIGLGFTLARLGDWKAAEAELIAGVKQAETQLADQPTPEELLLGWTLFFNAATGYAQAYDVARADSSVPVEERRIAATRMYSESITQLREAVNRAAKNGQLAGVVISIETDRELNPIRSLTGFQELLKQAKDAAGMPSASQPESTKPASNTN